jgi:hypothetical protein
MKISALLIPVLLGAAAVVPAQEVLSCGYAPGWTQTGAKRQYGPSNLYDYKDGGAEGYLVYGFVGMTGIDCKSGENTLAIDISEMQDADAAYGLFTANYDASQPTVKLGMGGQVQMQSAIFAKGKYFVEVVETAADPAANDAAMLRTIATAIEAKVEGRTTLPEPLQWFAPENLESAKLVPESVLGLRELKHGYVAKYKTGQAFILVEESPEAAAQVLKAVRARFPGATAAQVGDEAIQAQAQYLKGVCIFRKGKILAGTANLPDPQQAIEQAKALAARLP